MKKNRDLPPAAILLAAVIAAVVIITGCTSSSPSEDTKISNTPILYPQCEPYSGSRTTVLSTFENTDTGFNFNYPSDWSYVTYLGIVQLKPTDEPGTAIQISRERSEESFEEFTESKIRDLGRRGIFDLDESCRTILADATAHRLVYRDYRDADNPDLVIKTLEIWTEKNGNKYIVLLDARSENFDARLPDLYGILNSLKIS